MSLEQSELDYLTSRLGRIPRPAELHIVAAEWSEHCSYKSSKRHLRILPTDGPLVISEKGYDSGVLDVGGGYVVTAHIESHNHPSAVEPYGGAATGVGGVIRDILSAGTRPIAILDGLRFGNPRTDPKALWLFKNAVSGIADYGNCIGIPTVGGELEFDDSYAGYAMVDVAAIGFGKRDRLVRNHAEPGDVVVLLGGPTGRDGIGGSQFASDSLETEDRSAVQIPDPFIEKLLIEAVLEARSAGAIHAMKDLGGGGLSCAVSETADALGVGITINADAVHAREGGMSVEEIMTSESQERMLVITDGVRGLQTIREICSKFGVSHSVIGVVKRDGMMRVTSGGRRAGGGEEEEEDVAAEMPAEVVANARLLDLPRQRPAYLDGIEGVSCAPHAQGGGGAADYTDILRRLMTSPNIASRSWVYSQYDHEVGIRTVVRPGADASVLRLDNGRYLAVSMDGNPKHCYVNPRQGAIGCFEEACRNVVCTGAAPIGMLDHLQFGDPTDPGVFWTFVESVRGISDFAREMGIPCVGGKVSLYNETPSGPIKPTPVIAVLGLVSDGGSRDGGGRADDSAMQRMLARPADGDHIIVVGSTKDEMGGSEYYEYIRGVVGGRCPAVSAAESRRNSGAILDITRRAGLSHMVHDCSKGGLAAAVSEMCLGAGLGCDVDVARVPRAHDAGAAADGTAGAPAREMPDDVTLFSESHSRYVVLVPDESLQEVEDLLARSGAVHARIGRVTRGGPGGRIILRSGGDRTVADLSVDKTRGEWSGVLGGMVHGA
ncbi:MAG: phosphoribosylformylglycinamidine synthase subunit PurL [Thaumarchaeota archaeon]|nr:phosphoribosylformylglycinamidine synthase subunit PurL [Nitrososphaerota archaeon]MDE0525374.1 phosphoribosylformylglycinamidine synthase subunit PurL [Nitrososphaerota archaeon]